MALEANFRFLDGHRSAYGPGDVRMREADARVGRELLHAASRMRVMAIGAGHAHQVMSGRMEGHRGRVLLVAGQAQVLPRLFEDLAVRIVAGAAIEAVGTADLVRAGDLRQLGHVAVAAEAGIRRHRVQIVRGSAQRRQVRLFLEAGQPQRGPVAGRRNLPARSSPASPAGRCSATYGSWCRTGSCEHGPRSATGRPAHTRSARGTANRARRLRLAASA